MTKKNRTITIVKPVIKWIGGKTQIIQQVMSKFPVTINNYYEPFLGGGSVLLAFLSYVRHGIIRHTGKVYASDNNPILINLYSVIQQNPDQLMHVLDGLIATYRSIESINGSNKPLNEQDAMKSQESFYYWQRQRFNSNPEPILSAALLLFLNKTCFRGVYREGPHGFNVPFGNYSNPGFYDRPHIYEVSSLIRDVIFKVSDFYDMCKMAVAPDDFVYLDPPYAPITATSFTDYTRAGFAEHSKLFEFCRSARARFLLSNSTAPIVLDAFHGQPGILLQTIVCKRAINSKRPESKATEVLVSGSGRGLVPPTDEVSCCVQQDLIR